MNLTVMNKCFFICLVLVSSTSAMAQRDTGKTQTIDITSAYKPVLRNAVKINFYGTQLAADTGRPVLQYQIPSQNLFYSYQPITLRPLRLAQDTNLYLGNRNYVKLGYGNYKTPYLGAGISMGDGKKGLLNLYVDYVASKGKDFQYQNYSAIQVKAAGSAFTPANELYGAVSVGSRDFNLYGYDHSIYSYTKDDVRQKFLDVALTVGVKNRVPNEMNIQYNPSVSLRAVNNKGNAKEMIAGLHLPASYRMNDELSLMAAVDIAYAKYSSQDMIPNDIKLSNTLIQLAPALEYKSEQLKAHVGITPVWNNDEFNWLPDVYAEARFGENVFLLQGGFVGRYSMNSYARLSEMNPYLAPLKAHVNTKELELYGGIKATLNKHFNINAKAAVIRYNDLPLFINDTAYDEKSFVISYADKANNFKVHGDISYISQDKFTATAGLTFNGYTGVKGNAKAWHTAPLELNGSIRWWAMKRLMFKADFNMFKGVKYVTKAGTSKELKAGKDLGIGAEFKINKQWSAWADVNNLLNDKYERWNNYRVYGTNVMGGIIYRF